MFSPSCGYRPMWHVHVSYVLVFALMTGTFGVAGFAKIAHALQVSDFSDTLSTSKPNVPANHTIEFRTPSGVAEGETIVITMPAGFTVSAITEDDVDVRDDGIDLTTAPACGASNASVTILDQTITVEICASGGGAIAGDSVVSVLVGDHASEDGVGSNQITNHSNPGNYELLLGGTMEDYGFTRIVVIDSVQVSGAVQTYFSFSIDGVSAGESVNGDLVTLTGTSTATTVPFGLISPETEYVLAQDLSVTSNSLAGFTVTVEATGDLESNSSATINSFSNGTNLAIPGPWAPPSEVVGNDLTYGHWGLTSEDISLSDGDSFADALYAGNFIGTPREVMHATSSADGTTEHIGKTRVGYKLEISVMQEAGSDYTTALQYVATPVF
jgi:hypothetical protein